MSSLSRCPLSHMWWIMGGERRGHSPAYLQGLSVHSTLVNGQLQRRNTAPREHKQGALCGLQWEGAKMLLSWGLENRDTGQWRKMAGYSRQRDTSIQELKQNEEHLSMTMAASKCMQESLGVTGNWVKGITLKAKQQPQNKLLSSLWVNREQSPSKTKD